MAVWLTCADLTGSLCVFVWLSAGINTDLHPERSTAVLYQPHWHSRTSNSKLTWLCIESATKKWLLSSRWSRDRTPRLKLFINSLRLSVLRCLSLSGGANLGTHPDFKWVAAVPFAIAKSSATVQGSWISKWKQGKLPLKRLALDAKQDVGFAGFSPRKRCFHLASNRLRQMFD